MNHISLALGIPFMGPDPNIERKIYKEINEKSLLLSDLIDFVYKNDFDKLHYIKSVLNVEREIELFYAPAPLKDIEGHLLRHESRGSYEASIQLEEIYNGRLKVHNNTRDYSIYEDFIASLKRDLLVSRSEKGFLIFMSDPKVCKHLMKKKSTSELP